MLVFTQKCSALLLLHVIYERVIQWARRLAGTGKKATPEPGVVGGAKEGHVSTHKTPAKCCENDKVVLFLLLIYVISW